MDNAQGMAAADCAPYYSHGDFSVAPPPPDPFSTLNQDLPLAIVPSNSGEGVSDETAHSPRPLPLPAHAGSSWDTPGATHGESLKAKRGRARRCGPDGNAASALVASPIGGESETQKRRRGRPPGTGTKQQLASFGELFSASAGMGFLPHAIEISPGEDLFAKIMSFSQNGPRAICILSASGLISSVTLRQPDTCGGTMTYEGHFEILCLSGLYFLADYGSSRSRAGGLSITLSSSDGRVIGGAVGGQLITASSVQVTVASFIYGGSKVRSKQKPKTDAEIDQCDSQQMLGESLIEGELQPLASWSMSRETMDEHIDMNQSHS